MIKRRFYNVEHGDRSDDSDSSSSSSSDPGFSDSSKSESGPERPGEEEAEEVTAPDKGGADLDSPSPGSGYESEDSSWNEVHCDSSGLPVNDDDDESTEEGKQCYEDKFPTSMSRNKRKEAKLSSSTKFITEKDASQPELDEYVLKCKSVFKCRLCPRIVCLSEETLKTHINSKRHARSKKLLNEGRLKLMLNSDGEIEEEQETHAERHARTIALAQDLENLKKRNKGRQRQRNRLKNKGKVSRPKERKVKPVANTRTKKKRRVKD